MAGLGDWVWVHEARAVDVRRELRASCKLNVTVGIEVCSDFLAPFCIGGP